MSMGLLGRKPDEPPIEPPPEDSDYELDEVERLGAWEFLQLLDLSFTPEQGRALLAIPHFTWHDADGLLKKGATHAQVVELLT